MDPAPPFPVPGILRFRTLPGSRLRALSHNRKVDIF